MKNKTDNNLKKKDIAEKLKVSNSYISQILNGDFNFTLKKLIELGLVIGKIPYLEFIGFDEYWKRERNGGVKERSITNNITYHVTIGQVYSNVAPEKFRQVKEILEASDSTPQSQDKFESDFKSNPIIKKSNAALI